MDKELFKKDLKVMRVLCTSFMTGYLIGTIIIMLVLLLIGSENIMGVLLSLLFGFLCTLIAYGIMGIYLWDKHRKRE